MTYQAIMYEVSEHIATITLHRPKKMNAFTAQMMTEIISALNEADSDDVKEGVTAFLEKRDANFPCKPSKDMPDCVPWRNEPEY